MSTVDDFMVDYGVFSRMATISGGNKALSPICSGYGLLNPIADRSKLLDDGNYGKEYHYYTNLDIKVGDIGTINGREYGVGGFSDWPDIFEDNTDDFRAAILTVKNVNA